jgi:hypothetical protein
MVNVPRLAEVTRWWVELPTVGRRHPAELYRMACVKFPGLTMKQQSRAVAAGLSEVLSIVDEAIAEEAAHQTHQRRSMNDIGLCDRCERPLIEVDHYGTAHRCIECNRWRGSKRLFMELQGGSSRGSRSLRRIRQPSGTLTCLNVCSTGVSRFMVQSAEE